MASRNAGRRPPRCSGRAERRKNTALVVAGAAASAAVVSTALFLLLSSRPEDSSTPFLPPSFGRVNGSTGGDSGGGGGDSIPAEPLPLAESNGGGGWWSIVDLGLAGFSPRRLVRRGDDVDDVDAESASTSGDEAGEAGGGPGGGPGRRRIRRLAVLRPFGTRVASVLSSTFDDWDDFLPCDTTLRAHQRRRRRRGESGSNAEDETTSTNDDDDGDDDVRVDLVLSFSQDLETNAEAAEGVRRAVERFRGKREEALRMMAGEESGEGFGLEGSAAADVKTGTKLHHPLPWAACFDDIRVISTSILPERDLYLPRESVHNPLWVNGPNRQFVASMEALSSTTSGGGAEKEEEENVVVGGGGRGGYDATFLMEGDSVPVKEFWLDDLLKEAEGGAPFAILGSKYVGDSWDKFRSSLPLSLQHHLNGNAVYNLTHPLMRDLLRQLDLEADTPYNAVPYDYRMSQILVEGMLGVKPEVPAGIVSDFETSRGIRLGDNTDAFRAMWEEHGGDGVMRESRVIANYAGTNLLPRHVEGMTASVVHGAQHYLPWDGTKFNITLVITEWHDELALNLLSRLDSSDHPFSNVVLMVPQDLTAEATRHLAAARTSLPVRIERRTAATAGKDYMDLCSAPVESDWFMLTNSYHVVADHVDLLFREEEEATTEDSKGRQGAAVRTTTRQIVPYTPADARHCSLLSSPACAATIGAAREQFDPRANKVVQNDDIVFNTAARDEYCAAELLAAAAADRRRFDADGKEENPPPRRPPPSATSYVAYLSGRRRSDAAPAPGSTTSMYGFTDRTTFGARNHFVRSITEEEERAASEGDGSALSNRILSRREGGSGTGLELSGPGRGGIGGWEESTSPGARGSGDASIPNVGSPDARISASVPPMRSQFDPMLELRRMENILRAPTGPSSSSWSSAEPSAMPPTLMPSAEPSAVPSSEPSLMPSVEPSTVPSTVPSEMPSSTPTLLPSTKLSTMPSDEPTLTPSTESSTMPSTVPTLTPSDEPSAMPSSTPSLPPSAVPSAMPSSAPTLMPSAEPSAMPSDEPTRTSALNPTAAPLAGISGTGGGIADKLEGGTNAPTPAPVEDAAEQFYKCRDWCDAIEVPWWSASSSPGGLSKCEWVNFCWKCQACGGEEGDGQRPPQPQEDRLPVRERRRRRRRRGIGRG